MIDFLKDEREGWIGKVYVLLLAMTFTMIAGTHLAFRQVSEEPAPAERAAVAWPALAAEPRMQSLNEIGPAKPASRPRAKVRAAADAAPEGEPLRP